MIGVLVHVFSCFFHCVLPIVRTVSTIFGSRHQLLPPALEDALRGSWCIDRGLDVGLHQLQQRVVPIRGRCGLGVLGVLGVGEEEVQVAVDGQDLAETQALILILGCGWNMGYFRRL